MSGSTKSVSSKSSTPSSRSSSASRSEKPGGSSGRREASPTLTPRELFPSQPYQTSTEPAQKSPSRSASAHRSSPTHRPAAVGASDTRHTPRSILADLADIRLRMNAFKDRYAEACDLLEKLDSDHEGVRATLGEEINKAYEYQEKSLKPLIDAAFEDVLLIDDAFRAGKDIDSALKSRVVDAINALRPVVFGGEFSKLLASLDGAYLTALVVPRETSIAKKVGALIDDDSDSEPDDKHLRIGAGAGAAAPGAQESTMPGLNPRSPTVFPPFPPADHLPGWGERAASYDGVEKGVIPPPASSERRGGGPASEFDDAVKKSRRRGSVTPSDSSVDLAKKPSGPRGGGEPFPTGDDYPSEFDDGVKKTPRVSTEVGRRAVGRAEMGVATDGLARIPFDITANLLHYSEKGSHPFGFTKSDEAKTSDVMKTSKRNSLVSIQRTFGYAMVVPNPTRSRFLTAVGELLKVSPRDELVPTRAQSAALRAFFAEAYNHLPHEGGSAAAKIQSLETQFLGDLNRVHKPSGFIARHLISSKNPTGAAKLVGEWVNFVRRDADSRDMALGIISEIVAGLVLTRDRATLVELQTTLQKQDARSMQGERLIRVLEQATCSTRANVIEARGQAKTGLQKAVTTLTSTASLRFMEQLVLGGAERSIPTLGIQSVSLNTLYRSHLSHALDRVSLGITDIDRQLAELGS